MQEAGTGGLWLTASDLEAGKGIVDGERFAQLLAATLNI